MHDPVKLETWLKTLLFTQSNHQLNLILSPKCLYRVHHLHFILLSLLSLLKLLHLENHITSQMISLNLFLLIPSSSSQAAVSLKLQGPTESLESQLSALIPTFSPAYPEYPVHCLPDKPAFTFKTELSELFPLLISSAMPPLTELMCSSSLYPCLLLTLVHTFMAAHLCLHSSHSLSTLFFF